PRRNNHLSLRGRRTFRARCRKPAKNGVQKRPLDGWRPPSLEGRRFADHRITSPPRLGSAAVTEATLFSVRSTVTLRSLTTPRFPCLQLRLISMALKSS